MLSVKKVVQFSRDVRLEGLRPLLLNPYPGDNKTKLPVEKRFYFDEDGKSLVIPVRNIVSFLGAQNTRSASKYVGDPRKSKDLGIAFTGMVNYEPGLELPLMRNGKQIKFEGFGKNGITMFKCPGRLANGVVSDTEPRPLIGLPWSLSFQITWIENDFFNEDLLQRAFDVGGKILGFGAYRGLYGKFEIAKWDVIGKKKK